LTPQLAGMRGGHGSHADPVDSLPFASTLCGACYEVCPVKIDIPSLLVRLRAQHVENQRATHALRTPEQLAMSAMSWMMASPKRFKAGEALLKLGRVLGKDGRITSAPPPLNRWTATRDAPEPPAETFRQWWTRTRGRS
jgi:L-lactate dehydrogenase complex protein LldF